MSFPPCEIELSNGGEEAARAYDAAAIAKFGEFARLNFPREQAGRSEFGNMRNKD